MKTSSFKLKASDGINLFIRNRQIKDSKVTIILIHGLGEHSGRYIDLINEFNKLKISLFAMDIRGHGKSGGKRGHTPTYNQLMDDIQLIIYLVKEKTPNQKRFLYGHSMGGSLVLNYALLQKPQNINGLIITSPAFRPAFDPPKIKLIMGKLLKKLIPSLTLNNELELSGLARSQDVMKKYLNDPLVHDRLSIQLGLDLLKYGELALDFASKYNFPTLICHGKKDKLTSFYASKEFSENSGSNIKFIEFENAYHEIHNEPEKDQLILNIHTWMKNMM